MCNPYETAAQIKARIYKQAFAAAEKEPPQQYLATQPMDEKPLEPVMR